MKKRSAKIASTLSRSPAASVGDCNHKEKYERRLVKYEALPKYLKDNEFIRDYYRCEWPLKDVTLSIFSLHNETLNIWTHLVGFMIFAGLMVMNLTKNTTIPIETRMSSLFSNRDGSDGWLKTKMMNQSNGSINAFIPLPAVPDSYLTVIAKPSILHGIKDSNSELPLWPWFVFLVGAMSCLIFSSISHLFACHSRRFYFFFWRLDYAGISLMIVCSFFAPIYYAFLDHPYSCLLYLTSITIGGILIVITLLTPALSSARFRSFRATLFLSMGFSGVIPATHAVILHWDHPQIHLSLGYEVAMGILYGVGAVFYVSRIPERWKPGAFDIVGHSHQIFHAFVVAAALAHTVATLIIMDWRRGLMP